MIDFILVLLLGMFVGWNFEQPAYAKAFQAWIMTKYRNFRNKGTDETPEE